MITSTRTKSLIGLLFAVLFLVGCDQPNAPTGESVLAELNGGVLLTRLPWVHPPTLYNERQEVHWWLPHSRFMVVHEEDWGGPEDWGAWGLGEQTRVTFALNPPGSGLAELPQEGETLDVFIRSMAAELPGGSQQDVSVWVNEKEIGQYSVGQTMENVRLTIPAGTLRLGANDLELRYACHREPTDNDDRLLALGIQALGLVPTADSSSEPDPGLMGPGYTVNEERQTLLLATSGTYVVPFQVPENANALLFELRALGRLLGGGGKLRVGAITLDDNRKVLLDSEPSRETLRLPLNEYQGRQIFLFFDADVQPGSRLAIQQPRLESGAAQPVIAEKAESAPTLPDIAVVVLDAARVDHFSAYGYERETSPRVDEVASEGLIFENAVSECSYTLCAMPSLLAGLSFIDHGLVLDSLALRPEIRTLADALTEKGYFTFGLTANPNSSTMTQADQGFEEYQETWEFHPDALADLALERLRQGWGDRPLFLVAHFVPPHEPYTPTPEFDIFGDSNYDGPMRGDRESIMAIYNKEVDPSPEDMAELVALYDGNLRMGDAAAGRLFDFLRESGRWENTLVVITSDHGEAFGEHGEVGHNTTVFDVMLRVPLIVKLPASWPTPQTQTDRLVTLNDVVVTLDQRLGLGLSVDGRSTGGWFNGVDLLSEPEVAATERLIALRSANDYYPWLGIRGERFKATALRGLLPELYDLANDPNEEQNIFLQRPLLQAGMIALLKREADRPGPLRAGARTEGLTDDQRRMLEALGYLQTDP